MQTEKKKTPLMGMTLDELRQVAADAGLPRFAAGQMARWIYQKGARDIEQMTDLSKAGRERLAEGYMVGAMEPVECQRSADGTTKYMFPIASGKMVETVFIPDGERATLCVSSQVGCRMNCLFCQTGKQGFEGNLTAGDILNQIMQLPERERLTNIVYMGQGEPLDNLDSVLKSADILMAGYGWAWSPKRITISTVGLKAGLRRLMDESPCHVAVSMHSATPEKRRGLMPAEGAWSIRDVVSMLKEYDFSHQRRITFEYIMLKGLNDSPADARAILSLVGKLECRLNLIRYHKIPGIGLEGSDMKTMEAFRDMLTAHGLTATIRASRGEDILAACGLLSTARRREAEP